MKPEKARHLLSQYGEVTRIYLVPEDNMQRKRRVSQGGNKKKSYSEGWIEFSDRKVAKRITEALNAKQIGGKKRSFYHDDIWNLKYLKGFKWEFLTEKIAYENRIREQKLRMEIAQAKKENTNFLERLDRSKAIEKIKNRKVAQKGKEDRTVERFFRQNLPADERK
ncbi:hypothetical protein ABG067_006582 [Albugo candida]